MRLLNGLLTAQAGANGGRLIQLLSHTYFVWSIPMPNLKSLIRELARHAMTKKGAEEASTHSVHVPGASWSEFFEVKSADSYGPDGASFWNEFHAEEAKSGYKIFAYFPVYPHRLKEHKTRYPMILETDYVERDGHVQMAVPLDAALPVELLKALIDEAYAIVWNKLGAASRVLIELGGLPYDEPKLMDRLIDVHNLKEHRKAIHKIARHAILLRTKKSSEAKIPLAPPRSPADPICRRAPNGLPTVTASRWRSSPKSTWRRSRSWNAHQRAPRDGLLSLFSVWGWMEEGVYDPAPPPRRVARAGRLDGGSARAAAGDAGTPQDASRRQLLQGGRRRTDSDSLLPRYRIEPPLATLGWADDEYERFDRMQSDYHSLQMKHWLKNSDAGASHHLLGGYALFQQEFPEEVLEMGLAMFLQIGSDANSVMYWGDGGELTFYADAKALARGRFERIWGTCQCG